MTTDTPRDDNPIDGEAQSETDEEEIEVALAEITEGVTELADFNDELVELVQEQSDYIDELETENEKLRQILGIQETQTAMRDLGGQTQ
jgi:regulator of replication initiation timing